MDNNGIARSTTIIIIIIIIAIVGIISLKFLNNSNSLDYFTGKGKSETNSNLIEDYETLKGLIKSKGVEETIVNAKNFNKANIKEYFNDEYFESKKLAILSLYEDTSKDYIISIDKIIYNNDKTEATIEYTYKTDGYAGMLNDSWFNYLFIELDLRVQNVNFVKSAVEE